MNTISLEHNPNANNMAGILKVIFINAKGVKSVLPLKDEVTVTLDEQAEAYSSKARDIDVQSVMIKAGLYEHSIQLRLYSKNANHAMALDAMARKRFVAVILYNNDISCIIGTQEEPLRFTFEDVSDGKPDGTTAYILKFHGKTTDPQRKVNKIK